MSGPFLVGPVRQWLHRRSGAKLRQRALQWPLATAQVNHWQILEASPEAATPGALYQVEAGFHFILNGEYYGGYLRSVAMPHGEAARHAKGTPSVNVRYDPAHPDSAVALPDDNKDKDNEDNAGALPFRIFFAGG